jgi:hypothetical protein
MKLVMTLIARDESDIVDAQIAFHLNAGVDYVVAVDHGSTDGTTDILERYAREGHAHVTRVEDVEYREVEWRTQMARRAASELDADWVLNSDADEFWWPRGSDLKEVLASLPERYGVIRAFWRPFVPRPDDGVFFAERMTVRLAPEAAIHDPSSHYRPNAKVIHRADPRLTVGRGNHGVDGVSLQPLRGWYPESALQRGLEDGSLVVDTRLRDALRMLAGDEDAPVAPGATFPLPGLAGGSLRFPRPSVVDDAAYAVEASVLGEADVVRLQRRLDELNARLARLEGRPLRAALRRTRRLARRVGSGLRHR